AAPPPPPPSPPPRGPWRPPIPPVSIDWEGLVGVKLFSWIAGIALVFAAVFFISYSIQEGWISDSVKMAIGLLVGTGLLVACELPAARRYAVTANAMDAAGIAVLFMTFFASHARWHLVPQGPTFLLMALVTAVAVALSIRRDSVFIAILGLFGGFLTPALLSPGEDRPIGLFGYLLLLNVGLAWVAYQKRWAPLTAVSVVLTALYQWAWVLKFLHASSLPLAMAIFLVFPVMQMGALLLGERDAGDPDPLFGRAALTASLLPLLFVLYLAAVPTYGAHVGLLFGFALLIGAGLGAVAIFRGPVLVHLIGGAGVVAAFVVWCGSSYSSSAWPQVLVWVSLAVALYLAMPVVAERLGKPLGAAGEWSRFVAPALLFVFPFLAYQEPGTADPALLFGVLSCSVSSPSSRPLPSGASTAGCTSWPRSSPSPRRRPGRRGTSSPSACCPGSSSSARSGSSTSPFRSSRYAPASGSRPARRARSCSSRAWRSCSSSRQGRSPAPLSSASARCWRS
ncbi:MAG: DUF2339 domain-containing protein, partial [Candidatus Binatia bacterium]